MHARKKWEILTRNGKGPLMWFDGKKFTDNGSPKLFTFQSASKTAKQLLSRFKVLSEKGYKVWVRVHGVRRENPDSPGIETAARKFEEFSGHEATQVIETNLPTVKEGLVIGELDVLGYRAKRKGIDGDRVIAYGHRFHKKSRPLLAVSQDGKQLIIVGGRYEFTEAGIEDR
jgi:hypothetical protein